MFPFFVLLISTLLLRVVGMAGVRPFDSWTWCLRGGLALMFLFTASAHWGKRRGDLIAIVPRLFPRPDLMVSATGVFEILGGLGLLIPAVAPLAAAGAKAIFCSSASSNIAMPMPSYGRRQCATMGSCSICFSDIALSSKPRKSNLAQWWL